MQVGLYFCGVDVLLVAVGALHGLVHHHGLGGGTEHLLYGQVERADAIGLFKGETMVAGGLAHGVHRGTFTFGYPAHVFNGFLVYQQSHALLALVGDNFFCRQGLVADGQLVHVYQATAFFHKFAQAVDVSCGSMVVNAYDGVGVFLAEGTHHVVGALLHLGVGTLHGVQLYSAAVSACLHGTDATAAQADAVVLTTHHHHLVAGLRLAFQAVAACTVAHTACQHDNLVVGIALPATMLLVLERQYGAADQGLAELVAEVAGTVGCLDQYLLGCLVEPFSHGQEFLPFAGTAVVLCAQIVVLQTGVGGHVHRCACYWHGAYATAHTVAYFAATAGGGSVERLHGGGEVVRLGFKRDNAVHLLNPVEVRFGMVGRCEQLHLWAAAEGHVVLVGRQYMVGVLLRGLLDHLEQAALFLLAVDDEGTAEYLVTAVLAVDLCKTEYLGVCQVATQLTLHTVQVLYLLGAQCQALLLVVGVQVCYLQDGLGLDVHAEDVLVQAVLVHALQHGVELGVLVGHGEILLYAFYAVDVHVLGYLHSIGAPRGDHLAARANETSLQAVGVQHGGLAIQPAQFFNLSRAQRLGTARSNDALLWCFEEGNCHICKFLYYSRCKVTEK